MTNQPALTRRTLIVGAVLIAAVPAHAGYTELSAQQAADHLAMNPETIVLDIRTPGEFASGHIAGAINIDFFAPDFAGQLRRLDANKTYIVHCAVGGRSRSAEAAFAQAGIANVLHLTRGIESWRALGLPLTN